MNYDQARQRAEGRWDWTTMNDGVVRPKGYCAGWRYEEPLPPYLEHLQKLREADRLRDEPLREKFHTDGHASAEEAVRCYYEYCLDHLHDYDMRGSFLRYDTCEVCRAPTSRGFDYRRLDGLILHVALCDAHRTLDRVRELRPCPDGSAQLIHS